MEPLKKYGPSLLALLAGGAIALGYRYQSSPKTDATKRSESSDGALCRLGTDRLVYNVDLVAGLQITMAGSESNQTAKFPLKAQMVVDPLRTSPSGQIAAATFENVEGQGMDLEAYKTPFLIEINSSCQVVAFARHKSAEPERARQEQVLAQEFSSYLANVSFSRAAGTGGMASGKDAQGEFSQRYETARDGDTIRVTAGDRTYTKVWLGELPSHVESKNVVTFDRGAWIASLTAERSFQTRQSIQTFTFTASRSSAGSSVSIPNDEAEYVWTNLLEGSRVTTTGNAPLPAEAEEIRKMGIEEAKKNYEALFDTEAHMGAAGTFLRNYAEAHPKFAFDVVKDVHDGKLDGMKAATVFPALQITRTKEARQALTQMREANDTAPFDKARATLALASRSDVTSTLVEALATEVKAASQNGGYTEQFGAGEAYLALGMAVSHGSEAVAAEAKQVLMDHAKSEHTGTAIAALVGGIANAGDPDFVAPVMEWTRESDSNLRYKVAMAFRRMPVEKTGEAQASWLHSERDLRVKGAIYDIAWKQAYDQTTVAHPNVLQLAVQDVQHRPDNFTLRQSLIRVLGEAAKTDKKYAQTLGEMYATEPNSDLRVLIGSYVSAEYLKERIEK